MLTALITIVLLGAVVWGSVVVVWVATSLYQRRKQQVFWERFHEECQNPEKIPMPGAQRATFEILREQARAASDLNALNLENEVRHLQADTLTCLSNQVAEQVKNGLRVVEEVGPETTSEAPPPAPDLPKPRRNSQKKPAGDAARKPFKAGEKYEFSSTTLEFRSPRRKPSKKSPKKPAKKPRR